MAQTFVDQLFNEGKLPDINVNVQIDNDTIIRISLAVFAVMVLSIFLHMAIAKHTK